MNPSELSLMKGMVDILNRHLKEPFLTEEQYKMRLEDLKQFEEESNFIFTNSPTCKDSISSLVETKNIIKHRYKRCNDINDIINFANQKDMLVYLNLTGANVIIVYVDGVMSKFIIDNAVINLSEIDNIPYKINKKDAYIISGILSYDLKFYATNVGDDCTNLKDGFAEVKQLGFDVIPHWIASNFAPKAIRSNMDYVLDYANEEGLSFDGIVFRFNDISYNGEGMIYEMLK